jgi:hypothetical protein
MGALPTEPGDLSARWVTRSCWVAATAALVVFLPIQEHLAVACAWHPTSSRGRIAQSVPGAGDTMHTSATRANRADPESDAGERAGGLSAIAATRAMARRPASFDRPPDSSTTAVRGGLVSTANAPISAARMLPTPTAAKSRLTFSSPSGSLGNERTTAAVCNRLVGGAGSQSSKSNKIGGVRPMNFRKN